MKPSLDGAYARINRAAEHIRELKAIQDAIPAPDVDRTELDNIPPDTETLASIVVGETIYNLRAALDYLIYELAFLNSGSIQEGTQFPIESTPDGWKRRLSPDRSGKPGYVQFLSGPHQTAILRLQPCSGVDWTKRLRDISNPDKHKRLTITLIGTQEYTVRWADGMHVGTIFTPLIVFDDGASIIETLEILQQRVTEVIDSFKPEF